MTVRILIGDCREKLRELPDASVHCCVTSPPYFGLRDYGHAGQMGLEPTPDEFVAGMVAVFREVRRVLRDDGTLWLNIGDSYAGSWGAQGHKEDVLALSGAQIKHHPKTQKNTGSIKLAGVKPKDLYGIPWMLAFALRADGWYLRQDIIWSKPNPMPESVRDRCTKAHEYVFLLSKGPRYHFDADAIAEEAREGARKFNGSPAYKAELGGIFAGKDNTAVDSRNKRSVWEVATQPFSGAHFATFPPALIEPCIKAGCPAGGTVLDPFGGAGTTGLVADRLGRNAVLVELNPAYAAIAEQRIANDAGLFGNVEAA